MTQRMMGATLPGIDVCDDGWCQLPTYIVYHLASAYGVSVPGVVNSMVGPGSVPRPRPAGGWSSGDVSCHDRHCIDSLLLSRYCTTNPASGPSPAKNSS